MGTPLTIDLGESLAFVAHRQVVTLFKEYLTLLAELRAEHDESLAKLCAVLPEEHQALVECANYFTPEKAERLRKAVLARGNDCSRAIQDEIAKYEIQFRT